MAGAYKTGKYRPEDFKAGRQMMNVFIMKPVMIWDIWRIPAIMM